METKQPLYKDRRAWAIFAIALAALAAVIVSRFHLVRAFRNRTELLRLPAQVQHGVSLAHLWLEEGLAARCELDFDVDVAANVASALGAIDTALDEAAGDALPTFAKITDPKLRSALAALRSDVGHWSDATRTRWQQHVAGVLETDEDRQRHQAAFERLLPEVGGIDSALRASLDSTWTQTVWMSGVVMLLLIGSAAWIALFITRQSRSLAAQNRDLERRVEDRTAELDVSEAKNTALLEAERQRTMTALRENEARLHAILDNTDAVVYAKDLEGRFLFVNRRFERLTGVTAGAALGRRPAELFAKEVAAHFVRLDEDVMMQGAVKFEDVLLREDGPHTYSTAKFPLLDAAGAVVALCGVSTDTTDRKLAELDLQGAKDAAETATRAKSDFLANMSHEIRTPLNAVIGMTALLLDTRLDGEQLEYAETIRRSGEALLTLISDVLDFSKIESGKLELEESEFVVAELIEESLDIVAQQAAAKGLELAYHAHADVPAGCVGDAGRIRQVLLNLLSNAVKFTEHGEVSVWVSAAGRDDGRQELRFSVRDTGIGIAPDRRDRLFLSFSQLDRSTTRRFGGSGLGLAISKAICEMMEGGIWVESEPGRGSNFQFTIVVGCAPSPPAANAQVLAARLYGKRVLLVDDSAVNRQILEMQTKAWGMRPRSAADAAEALALLRSGEEFDVAILDSQMAGKDGAALAREMRALVRGLPILMLTSLGRRSDAGSASSGNIQAFLTKPVKPAQLMRTLVALSGPVPESATEELGDIVPLRPVDGNLRILVAEDNPVNLKVLIRMLDKLGCRADVAATGLEVLAAIERAPYDLVLMDVQMPDMDGLEATREVRRRRAGKTGPRIVAMTANARREDEAECLAAGMDGFVTKPVRFETLRETVAAVPARAPGRPVVLDTEVFDRLRALERDAPGVVREIVDLYLADAPRRIAALELAARQRDEIALANGAHGLKGSSGYIGAREMETLCSDVERHLREGRQDAAFAHVSAFDGALERLREALNRAAQ